MAERPPELIYAVDERPPTMRLIGLGLQYAVLSSVSLMLILIFARSAGLAAAETQVLMSLGLIAMAIGAGVQAYRGPLFGSGYLALPSFSAIYLGPAVLAANTGGLAMVAGMTVFAGIVEITMSILLPRIRVVFQPMISGLIILMVGIELGLIGMDHLLDIKEQGSTSYLPHIAVALATFSAAVGLSIWGRGALRLMCSLLALIVGVSLALSIGLIDGSTLVQLSHVPWLAIPDFGIISYGFDLSLVPVFLAAGVAAAIRSTGVYATAQRANDSAWKRPDVGNLQRGVFGDGLGATAAGLLGNLGASSAPSIVGMSVVTGATSRVIAFAAAGFLLIFAIIPKFTAAVVSLPLEIVGGIILFNATLMIASGLQTITTRRLDTRATIIVAVSMLLGLMTVVHPGFLADLPQGLHAVANSTLTVSLTAALCLTLMFRIGIRRRDAMPWPAADGPAVDISKLLDKESKSWSLAPDTVQRAKDTVAGLVTQLHDGHYLERPRGITSSFDDLELRIEMSYYGRPIHMTVPGPLAIHHEESAGSAGLSTDALAAEADRTSVTTAGDEVTISLWFSV